MEVEKRVVILLLMVFVGFQAAIELLLRSTRTNRYRIDGEFVDLARKSTFTAFAGQQRLVLLIAFSYSYSLVFLQFVGIFLT